MGNGQGKVADLNGEGKLRNNEWEENPFLRERKGDKVGLSFWKLSGEGALG